MRQGLRSKIREKWYDTILRSNGSPRAQGFFDAYPQFFSSSETASAPDRLNQRYRALIEANQPIIEGKRILDLASHDGRWSFAASKAGAKYVFGVEARQHLVEAARRNVQACGVPAGAVEFKQGDLLAEMEKLGPGSFDTVFCFGFLYHTIDHMSVLRAISRLQPAHIVIDTWISSHPGCIIEVVEEATGHESQAAIADPGTPMRALKGNLSKGALEMMVKAVGFPVLRYYDWRKAGIKRWNNLKAYYTGNRVTLVAGRAEN